MRIPANQIQMRVVPAKVAALYVDSRGPYAALLGLDYCWDQKRDARLYDGPWPVVAHPPCGPWSRLAHLTKFQAADCGPIAFDQVRRFGGVLEQPAGSKMFRHCGAPRPGELPDEFGGVSIEVEQVRWGHVARKRTWLYLVGVRHIPDDPPPREPTHWISGFRTSHKNRNGAYPAHYKQQGCAVPAGIKVCSREQRNRTPVQFAEYLIALARSVER